MWGAAHFRLRVRIEQGVAARDGRFGAHSVSRRARSSLERGVTAHSNLLPEQTLYRRNGRIHAFVPRLDSRLSDCQGSNRDGGRPYEVTKSIGQRLFNLSFSLAELIPLAARVSESYSCRRLGGTRTQTLHYCRPGLFVDVQTNNFNEEFILRRQFNHAWLFPRSSYTVSTHRTAISQLA